ncbi:ABC transporter [Enterobacillus tribolii]|uniref:Lauroyl/myristoyl acyltransferase n=1 Tax=Enterobacillus tribolii TaxID=1487935 RepID=A0A370QQT8_9GAMM|nr:ABC transporter [Enterobacillus tribolii]MBW7981696.1 ABC transporter [Enterobacillus tribolii]RDK91075.1 lauroyl/myristoyl acyltransferase [Enterobacillus tribolii]
MRFFAVWLYLSWKNFTGKLAEQVGKSREWHGKTARFLFRHLDYRAGFLLAHISRGLRLTGRRRRNLALVAEENKRCLLGPDAAPLRHTWVSQRRQLLDLAATYGQSAQIQSELKQCADQLNQIVEPLHQNGSPVILAPMHMVSDILAGIVGSMVYPGKATVVVSSSAEIYQEQDRAMGGVNLTYCSIHSDNRMIAGNLMDSIMEAADHQRNIMIFPDITPDYTLDTNETRAGKLNCTLFNRPAHLHSGIIRLARVLSAQVVFYNLYYDKGIKIHIEPPVAARELKKKMPVIIEESITRHPADWLLWHAHSLYFINE